MAAWVLTLIAVLGYVSGFIVSGAVYSHLWVSSWDRADLLAAMLIWPVFFPCWGLFVAVDRYLRFLERTRDKKIKPGNVTTLPRVVTSTTNRWEE